MNFKKKVNGSWADTPHYIHKTDTDTITTLPTVIYPTSTTATVGLKGQTLQSSIPSPTSPVMPEGTGERTGNLIDENTSSDADATHINYNKSAPINLVAGQSYTFSCNTVCNGLYIRSAVDDSNVATANNAMTLTYTPTANVTAYCRIWNSGGITNLEPMLNLGSTPLPYEPHGYKIPISSASTTTPVYLGEVQTTRKVKKLVLTGGELWQLWNGNYYSSVIDRKAAIDTIVCSHFINSSGGITYNHLSSSGLKIAAAAVPFVTSVSELKAWLAAQYAAGTPVTVWYVLANDETGIVNEPLMKIGNYADSLTTSIPCTAGENTLDVQTTVAPSEVTAEFSGWHPVQSVHERINGEWD